MGYSSRASQEISRAEAELAQASFLQRTLDNAQQLDMPFLIWFVSQDPSFTGESALDLGSSGLIQLDGSSKPAWDVWHAASLRPLQVAQPEP